MLALTVTAAQIESTVQALPKVLTAAADLTAKAAALSPKAVPILQNVTRLLPQGPALAVLVQHVSADTAAILKAAPGYAPVLNQVIDVLQRAPALAPQIAAVTGPMAALASRVGEDPSLGPFAARLALIIQLAAGKSDAANAAGPTPSSTVGAGLDRLIPWLDRGLIVMRHPWLLVAVPAAILAVVGGTGFAVGRWRRR